MPLGPAPVHLFDEASLLAVQMALAARRPLLVRGEPGTGKSQLAQAVAVGLDRAFLPKTVFDPFTAMPIQIFNWASRPQVEFHYVAAAGIIVLLVVLLTLNGLAVVLRNWAERWRVQ